MPDRHDDDTNDDSTNANANANINVDNLALRLTNLEILSATPNDLDASRSPSPSTLPVDLDAHAQDAYPSAHIQPHPLPQLQLPLSPFPSYHAPPMFPSSSRPLDHSHSDSRTPRPSPRTLLRQYKPLSIAVGNGRPAYGRLTPTGRTSQAMSFSTPEPTLDSVRLWQKLSTYHCSPATFAFRTDHETLVDRLMKRLKAHVSDLPADVSFLHGWNNTTATFQRLSRVLEAREEQAATAWTFTTDVAAINMFLAHEENFGVFDRGQVGDPNDLDLDLDDPHHSLLAHIRSVRLGYAPPAGSGTSDLAAMAGSGGHAHRPPEEMFDHSVGSHAAWVSYVMEHKPKMSAEMQKDLSERGSKIGDVKGIRLKWEGGVDAEAAAAAATATGVGWRLDPNWAGSGTMKNVLIQVETLSSSSRALFQAPSSRAER